MDLRQGAHRPLGPLRAPGRASEIWRGGISDRLVVGCGAGGQDRGTPVTPNAAEFTRRGTLALGAGVLASVVTGAAPAQEEAEYHGISAFRDLKYPADFKHFDYVNPNAPKGGLFSHIGSTRAYNQNFNTFNSLNSYILKGDGAQGMRADVRQPDGAGRGRAGFALWARRPRGPHFARRIDLPLPDAPRHHVSRR